MLVSMINPLTLRTHFLGTLTITDNYMTLQILFYSLHVCLVRHDNLADDPLVHLNVLLDSKLENPVLDNDLVCRLALDKHLGHIYSPDPSEATLWTAHPYS
jgi:hypothetical protein